MQILLRILSGSFLLVLFLVSNVSALPFTFDTSNQGWEQAYIGRPTGTTYDQLYPNEGADWASSGHDNPGGHIYQTAAGIEKRAYWMGFNGSNSLGDLTGMELVTDIWSTNNWQTIANGSYGDDGNVYARWVIAKQVGTASDGKPTYNMYVSKRDFSINMNTLNGWETHSIILKEENFFRWPNYDAGTQGFYDLLTDYSSIGLYLFSGSDEISNYDGGTGTWNATYQLLHYGAYSKDGNETIWALDNFHAAPVPEPATLFLFGTGLICIMGVGRKLRLQKTGE